MSKRRVVITGLGVVSPFGLGKDLFWQGLQHGQSGIIPVSLFDTSALGSHLAGEVTHFNPESLLGRKGLKYLDRNTQLTSSAAALALADAGLPTELPEELEVGLFLGTAFGSLESISHFDQESLKEGPRSVNPMAFPRTVINSPAGHTAIKFKLRGPNITTSAGSASSLQAISYAAEFIRSQRAEVLLAGGAEELCLASYIGFHKMKFLSVQANGQSEQAAPFDIGRNGMILGEGAALLVLEELDHAISRQANIYAEVLGDGSAHDAYHSHRYRFEGTGAARAMLEAVQDAGLAPPDVDYISAHANGSPLGDAMEANAIRQVFGEGTSRLAISSIKSMLGESLGASGALQAVSSILTLIEGIIPPTLNFEECDSSWGLQGLSHQAQHQGVEVAMINSLNCDGNNASLLLGHHDYNRK